MTRAAAISRGEAGEQGTVAATGPEVDSSADATEALDALGATPATARAVEQDTSIEGNVS